MARFTKKQMVDDYERLYNHADLLELYERESESLHFWLTIPRNRICRKVQDAVWECDPIFEEGELEALAAGGL